MNEHSTSIPLDPESQASLEHMTIQEKVITQRVPGVRTVLVVFSSKGMVYDTESLRQKIQFAYAGAEVYFLTPGGKPLGVAAPSRVDLLIDFTGPGERQGLFFARRLRRKARLAVGRDSGLFRKKAYDRVFDEVALASQLSTEQLQKERDVQRRVLESAGVALIPAGDSSPDRGKITPLALPPLSRH